MLWAKNLLKKITAESWGSQISSFQEPGFAKKQQIECHKLQELPTLETQLSWCIGRAWRCLVLHKWAQRMWFSKASVWLWSGARWETPFPCMRIWEISTFYPIPNQDEESNSRKLSRVNKPNQKFILGPLKPLVSIISKCFHCNFFSPQLKFLKTSKENVVPALKPQNILVWMCQNILFWKFQNIFPLINLESGDSVKPTLFSKPSISYSELSP